MKNKKQTESLFFEEMKIQNLKNLISSLDSFIFSKAMRILVLLFCFLVSQSCFAQHWSSLGSGLNHYSTKLYADSLTDRLYAAGTFTVVDGDSIWGIASWNGYQWDSLGNGIDNNGLSNYAANIWGLCQQGNYLYAGGNFRCAGYTNVTGFARWDGTNWYSVPGAVLSSETVVKDIVEHNNELYVCGDFDTIGGISANCIAKYDGVSCQPVGDNFDFIGLNYGFLTNMIFYQDTLFVAGIFMTPNQQACRFAKWNGSNWVFLPQISGGIEGPWDFEIYNNELYVCGLFSTATGNAGNGIMRWNGSYWQDVGGGVSVVNNPYPTVKEMCVHNGKLYCVGNFEKIGGVEANGLAVWDGFHWCGMDTYFELGGQSQGAEHIAFYHDTMYVMGNFHVAGTDSINRIAKWISGNYVDTCGAITGITNNYYGTNSFQVFPNPASNSLNIVFNQNQFSGEIILFDQFGREVWNRKIESSSPIEINTSCFADGMYFYRISGSNQTIGTGKFLVQH